MPHATSPCNCLLLDHGAIGENLPEAYSAGLAPGGPAPMHPSQVAFVMPHATSPCNCLLLDHGAIGENLLEAYGAGMAPGGLAWMHPSQVALVMPHGTSPCNCLLSDGGAIGRKSARGHMARDWRRAGRVDASLAVRGRETERLAARAPERRTRNDP